MFSGGYEILLIAGVLSLVFGFKKFPDIIMFLNKRFRQTKKVSKEIQNYLLTLIKNK